MLRLSNLVQWLAILGDPESEPKVVAKYLRVARPRYKQLVVSIETLLDIDTLSIEEVTGRLKAATDDEPTPAQTVTGELLLTEEHWLERYKKRDRGKGRGKQRGRGSGSGTSRASPDDVCKNCRKKGHWAKDCRSKKKEEQAHAAQDDEPTLMFAHGAVEEVPPPIATSEAATVVTTPRARKLVEVTSEAAADVTTPRQLELVEAKVCAAFDAAEDRDPKRWVLDTGATNHMTGSRAAFSDLDTGIVGTVRFGDDSVVKIAGRGTILFACKNGEHRTLANAYFIPRLTTNIISVGQLDEVGFQVLVEGGVMRIRDEERRLLAKIHRSPSRLYVLDVDIAQPVCLAAHAKEDAWLWHA